MKNLSSEAGDEVAHPVLDLIPDASKEGEGLIGGQHSRSRRILEALVDLLGVTRKDGATLLRVIADGDDVVERLPNEELDGLRPVTGHIDPNLAHHLDRLRADAPWPHPSTLDLEEISSLVT